jgi:hypothetical protein
MFNQRAYYLKPRREGVNEGTAKELHKIKHGASKTTYD